MDFISQEPFAGPPESIWLKYYCSNHQILLVGEGDFSFSLSLATSFRSAFNIVATSLDSYKEVVTNYRNAELNLAFLKFYGASVLHEVDATTIKHHVNLHMRKFDRIIFNFPHAGFFGREDDPLMIKMHKRLVDEFFMNASQMLRVDGEIHVNHKTTTPFCDWNIVQLAHQNSLTLIGCPDFNIEDYPGYDNKRGQGSRCDDPFFLGDCSTYIFCINHRAERTPGVLDMNAIGMQRNLPFQEIPISNHCHPYPHLHPHPYPTSFESNYSHSHISMQNHPTRFEPDYSQVTHSINPHSYQAPPPVVSLNQTYDTSSLDASRADLNKLWVLLNRMMEDGRKFNDDVHRLSILGSNYGEETERPDAHTTPGSFPHW